MNISASNISGDCNLKCAYSFNYPVSNCTAKNIGYAISLSYDTSSIPAATFNNVSYNVSQILLTTPSIHKYNGTLIDAELIIAHSPVAGGNNFMVCIPIVSEGTNTKASTLIQTIITATANQAPASGESTNIKLDNFTLNSIVPTTAFYSYTSTNKQEFVVYGISHAIGISQQSLHSLKSILKTTAAAFGNTFPSGPQLFFNANGPTNGIGGDGQIYIDCQPTGNSHELTEVTNVKPEIKFNMNMDSIMKNPIVIFIISSLFTIIILFVLYYLITFLSTGSLPAKMQSVTGRT